jgi:hypothetical protein
MRRSALKPLKVSRASASVQLAVEDQIRSLADRDRAR